MVDFKTLKTNSSLEKLAKKVEEQAKGNNYNDERYWQPTTDKAGNGTAVIRLLPTPPQDLEANEEALPFVKYYDHNFKGAGGWYIEKCLTTLGKADPCADYNNKLWNTNEKDNQAIARKQKRNTRYVSNVYVVSDPANTDAEGKVFLFRYGSKLFEKFQAAMNGDEDTAGFNPWSFDEGANFRIKIKNTKDKASSQSYRNYDDSKFLKPEVLSEDEAELEAIWRKEYSLQAEIAPDKFKAYDELQKQLNRALALGDAPVTEDKPKAERVTLPKESKADKPEPKEETTAETTVIPPWEDEGESDSTLAMFEKLAAED